MDTEEIRLLILKKGATSVQYSEADLFEYRQFLDNPAIRRYLIECQTEDDYEASGIFIGGGIAQMRKANFELAPGALLLPHGFLSIASDVGGNEICVDAITGFVYFAPHGAFDENTVYCRNEETGALLDIHGLTHDTILKALVLVSMSLESFLKDLLTDSLTTALDSYT